tara:strand:- start:342 stop:794 length:453 start_codon:yes stop_codon:yes gene_type:complete
MLRAEGWRNMTQSTSHERFTTPEETRSDDKSFGIVFAVFFLLVSFYLWWKGSVYSIISASLASFFLLTAFTIPRILKPLNIGWFYFGKFLNSIMSPVILAIIFFLVMMPIGLIMRILHSRDPLDLRYHKLSTYWVDRKTQPDPSSFKNQF